MAHRPVQLNLPQFLSRVRNLLLDPARCSQKVIGLLVVELEKGQRRASQAPVRRLLRLLGLGRARCVRFRCSCVLVEGLRVAITQGLSLLLE